MCKYNIVISDTQVSSFFMRNQEEIKIELQKKVNTRICVKDNTFLTAPLLSMSFFVAFFVYSLPLPKRRTCWMVTIKIRHIAMGDILRDDIMSERSKTWKFLQFSTSWLASLILFRLCFSVSCSGYDLTLIKKSQTLNCYSFLQKIL